MRLPRRRTQDLLVKDMGEEILAYDLVSDHVNHMTGVTASVWRRCDGTVSSAALAAELGVREADVAAAVRELAEAELLVVDGVTRRRMLAVAGTAVVAAPVLTLVAPTPASALSLPVVGPVPGPTGGPVSPPPAPTVTGISPSSGVRAGGTTVTITGTNFTPASAVQFGGVPAAIQGVPTSTSITAVSPPAANQLAASTVHVTVTTAGGTSGTSNADRFSYA